MSSPEPPDIEVIEEDLGFFDDWEERYRYLIDLGKALPEMPDNLKTPDNIVRLHESGMAKGQPKLGD